MSKLNFSKRKGNRYYTVTRSDEPITDIGIVLGVIKDGITQYRYLPMSSVHSYSDTELEDIAYFIKGLSDRERTDLTNEEHY